MTNDWSDAVEAEVLAQGLLEYAARLRERREARPSKPHNSQIRSHSSANASYALLARKMYRARRLRDKFLPAELLGEPLWDMLLDLYIARLEGRDISVTSLCSASAVPGTTALRWISVMESHGLAERSEAVHDKRVHFVKITLEGARVMQRYLRRVDLELLNDEAPLMFVAESIPQSKPSRQMHSFGTPSPRSP